MQANPVLLPSKSRPWPLYLVAVLLIVLGVGALPAGLGFISDPSGKLVGIPEGTLDSPIFPNYLVPGLFLFFVIGVGSLLAALFLFWQPDWKWPEKLNPVRHEEWAWSLATAIGVVAMVWIVVQVLSINLDSFLQPLVFGMGAAIVVLMLLKSVRTYFAR